MEFLNVYKDGEVYREQVFDLYERAFPAEEKKAAGDDGDFV